MKWFYNLKIAAKLILSFVLIALISAIVGFMGIQGLNVLKATIKKLNTTTLPEIESLLIINEAETAVKAAERTIFSQLDNKEQYEKETLNIENAYKRADEAWAIYESTIATEEEKAVWKEFTASWDQWKEDQQEFVQLVSQYHNIASSDTKKIAETIEEIKNQTLTVTSTSFKEVESLLNEIIETQKANANKEEVIATENGNKVTALLLTIIFIGIALSVFLGLMISRIISKPLIRMVDAAKRLALGDVNVNIDADTKDEIGILAVAFKDMIENIRKQVIAVEKIAGGDLTVEVDIRSDKDLLGIKLSEMIKENNEILNNIASASEQVAAGSKQVADSSMALSQGATEQASAIEELTASLDEISSQTKLNAQNADRANELASNAKTNAVTGNDQMKGMLKAMEEINEASANISKIIKVIDDIAFQTNILALNAAVEAARAGQHGKGFAVVAEEVRNLAARSANAAKETTDMIEGSIKKAEGGTRIARTTAEALISIVNEIDKVAVLVGDIANASNEQASGIEQINQGIMQVSQVVQNNSATSEESAAASEELTSQAVLMKDMVGRFRLKRNKKSSYKLDDISPEVLDMLENLSENSIKNTIVAEKTGTGEGTVAAVPRITLGEMDFGKY